MQNIFCRDLLYNDTSSRELLNLKNEEILIRHYDDRLWIANER